MILENTTPIKDNPPIADLIDYYCPFCSQKLFRGRVANFNMVCSGCNKLVRSKDIEPAENEKQY